MNDKIYKVLLFVAALVMPLVCGGVIYALVTDAYDAFEHFGFFKFLTSKEWSYRKFFGATFLERKVAKT